MGQGYPPHGIGHGAPPYGHAAQPAPGQEVPRQCLNGHGVMAKVNKRGITVDECPVCHSMWFDPGEFEAAVALLSQTPGFQPQPPAYYTAGNHRTQVHHGSSGGWATALFGGHHHSSSDRRHGGFHHRSS